MLTLKDLELCLLSYGPSARLKVKETEAEVGPDLLIALEGVGTFKGVTLEDRVSELLNAGKDLERFAQGVHRESTRRGHASIATSLILQFEVRRCSRVASMLLVSPPFASYLQESQRRRMVRADEFFIPEGLESGNLRALYEKTVEELHEAYKRLVGEGVELEDARYVLPLASKTSLFVTGSLETFVGFMLGCDEAYYPRELNKLGEMIKGLAEKVSPALTNARLSFKNPLPYYPYSNPYKPKDEIMEGVIREKGEPREPALLSLDIASPKALEQIDLALNSGVSRAATLNPLIRAVFLEPLSLAAYHQSIRHRTVPTSVESIYSAMERALRRDVVEPPKIKASEKLSKIFHDAVSTALDTYQMLLDEDVKPSDAVYLAPQSVRIYVVRSYNAFNLLWPQGYVGTRTCSYAQWEERKTAYSIWSGIKEKCPELAAMMGEKCKMLGYCPERKWCPTILKYHAYNDELHMKAF